MCSQFVADHLGWAQLGKQFHSTHYHLVSVIPASSQLTGQLGG